MFSFRRFTLLCLLCLLCLFVSPVDAKSQGLIVVAADGSGDFRTVQQAVDHVPDNNTQRVVIQIKPGVYLGRPWRPYARVVFLECWLGEHIRPEGWDNWRDPAREKTASFGEYKSHGPGANPAQRVAWSKQLTTVEAAAFSRARFFSSTGNTLAGAASQSVGTIAWADALKKPDEWYATVEALRIADNLLLYQRDSGGWPKNIDMAKPLADSQEAAVLRQKKKTDSTIDNGATFSQLSLLGRVYTAQRQERHRQSFMSGLDYLLKAQYANGGWPQFYPDLSGYYKHITFNDGAMIGVMKLLRDVAAKKNAYAFVDEARRMRAAAAVEKGIECILKTQILVNGKRTVWCAQHDEVTLAPAPARKYEVVSLSGGESVDIVRFLMSIQNPSRKVIESIEAAVQWFRQAQLKSQNGAPVWARFYQIGSNRPIFVGRDGVIKYNIAEIDQERRENYQWYVDDAAKLLNHDYPAWRKKNDNTTRVH